MNDPFLTELDGMIESTEEFIGDDKVHRWRDPEGRTKDLDALNHVRKLYLEWNEPEQYMGYTPGEDNKPERGAWPGEMYRA